MNERDILNQVANQTSSDGPSGSAELDELGAFLKFRQANFGLEGLPPAEQENLFLRAQISDLGFNPTPRTGVGTGPRVIRSQNEALRNQLTLLRTPVRTDDPRPFAQVVKETAPSAVGRFILENVFPDSPLVRDPTGFNIIGDLFTPVIGLSESQLQNLPGPAQPFARALQETLSLNNCRQAVGDHVPSQRTATGWCDAA